MQPTNLTDAQFYMMAGYFANPARAAHIELEIPDKLFVPYAAKYTAYTGKPIPRSSAVTILPPNTNKWGREMRIYFIASGTKHLPHFLNALLTSNTRHGYLQFTHRMNRIALIDQLYKIGFVIDSPQNEAQIRSHIPSAYLTDFNNGYALL